MVVAYWWSELFGDRGGFVVSEKVCVDDGMRGGVCAGGDHSCNVGVLRLNDPSIQSSV